MSSTARESRHIVQVGGGGVPMKSARTMIEAIGNLKNRLEQGLAINSDMYVEVLRRCLKEKNLGANLAKQVHDYINQSRMEQNIYVANNLVSLYIKCGDLEAARGVFDKLVKKNVFSWTIIIGGYAKHKGAEKAMELFNQMCQTGVQPNAFTFLSVLKACANPSALQWGKEVHACVRHAGLESDVRVGSALVHMYAKCGSIDDARLAFDKMEERNVITWNVMIGGLAEHGCGHEAYELFLQMQREGFKPNAITYMSILNACASAGALEWVKEVHTHAREAGFESDVRVGNALVHMYAKCGSIDDARLAFDKMEERDVVTWNVMIGGLAEHGCGHEAYELFLQMKREGFKPNAITYISILNACVSAGALEWVKEVHTHAREAGFESDVRVGNALVHMYAKCGSIDDARLAFDKMEERDVVTWNVMIGGLAEHGCGHEAYELFLQMKREGLKPDAFTYASILNACASAGALEWVKEVHTHAREAGFESDVRVGNALVHMYAKCGSIDDARLAFDKMEERDVVTWNVMIGGLAEHGCGHEAYELFLQMKREGLKPDAFTYASILNVCASAGALEWVKEVHTHAREAGFESDVRVGNALVHMYAKCGSIDDARLAFDKMEERDVVTWTVMIGGLAEHGCGHEAYDLFLQMKREGFKPNAITYISILNACASAGALEWVKEVHTHAREAGFESDVRVGNALVHMYAKCGSIDDARLAFDKMEERDVVTWNVMIGGLAEHGCGHEAYELFLQMKREGLKPDAFTYASILNACASAGALEWVKEVHTHAREAGFESDVRVGNALVHMYAKCGSIDDARLAFDKMEERDVVTWNLMIGGLAEHGCGHEAYELFLQMKREGLKPDAFTYASILNACASAGALEWVKEVHTHAREAGFESDVRVGNALVHMYAKCGSIDDARLAFDKMEERDVVTWSVMIGGLAQHGCGHEALEVFRSLIADGVKPDEISFVAVLSACSHSGLVDEGRRLFLAMTQDYGIEPTVVLCNCMVDVVGRAGHLEEAKLFIDKMPVEPNEATWGALLGACRTYGNVDLGKLAANERLKLEPMDASTYVLLSNIYAAAGKWEEVLWVRTMMQERGIRKEPGRSWIEVDNKVHDFVVGDTSHSEAKEIYAELRRLSETIKANGYIPETRLVLRNIEEEEKELALCSHSEKLAIAYGLMRTPLGQPIRVFKNLRVCSDCHTATKFVSKAIEREIVVRDANRFHHFQDGVCSCGDYW